MCDTALELYNDWLEIYFDEYYGLSDAKGSKMHPKYDSANLALDGYDCNEWYKEKSGNEEELDDLPLLEGDEEKY